MKTTKITRFMTDKEALWTVSFLGVTAAAVTMELYSAVKKDPQLPAWTNLAVKYVPKPVTMAAASYLSTWLPLHVRKYYNKARHVA